MEFGDELVLINTIDECKHRYIFGPPEDVRLFWIKAAKGPCWKDFKDARPGVQEVFLSEFGVSGAPLRKDAFEMIGYAIDDSNARVSKQIARSVAHAIVIYKSGLPQCEPISQAGGDKKELVVVWNQDRRWVAAFGEECDLKRLTCIAACGHDRDAGDAIISDGISELRILHGTTVQFLFHEAMEFLTDAIWNMGARVSDKSPESMREAVKMFKAGEL